MESSTSPERINRKENGKTRDVSIERLLPPEKRKEAIELLIKNSIKIDEGGNGIILKFDQSTNNKSEIEEVSEVLTEVDKKPEETIAKLLKVFNPETAQKEYARQSYAHKLLEKVQEENPQQEYAQIATPIDWENIEFENQDLIPEKENNNFGVIVMDHIEGVDLARYLFEKVAEFHHSLDFTQKEIQEKPSKVLIREVFEQTDVVDDWRQATNKSQKEELENQITSKEVMEQIKDFLDKKGTQKGEAILSSKILKKIENTIEALHNEGGGFYHNDLHERNIILQGVHNDEEETQPYLIDFGSATFNSPLKTISEKADKKITERYSSLTEVRKPHKRTEQIKEERERLKREINSATERFGREDWKQKKKKVLGSLQNEEIKDNRDLYAQIEGQQIPLKELKIDLIKSYLETLSPEKQQKVFLKEGYPGNQEITNKVIKLLK